MALFGLNNQELKALSMFIQDYFVGESIDFRLLELIFTKMGIVGKKGIKLDGKAKRIMSRLDKEVQKSSLEEFFGSAIKEQTIYNKKTYEETVMKTISSADFFRILAEKRLRHSNEELASLASAVAISSKKKDVLSLEKIQKAMKESRGYSMKKRTQTVDYEKVVNSVLDDFA